MAKPSVAAAGDGWDVLVHVSSKDVGDTPTPAGLLVNAVHNLALMHREEESIEKSAEKLTKLNDEIDNVNAVVAKGALAIPAKL